MNFYPFLPDPKTNIGRHFKCVIRTKWWCSQLSHSSVIQVSVCWILVDVAISRYFSATVMRLGEKYGNCMSHCSGCPIRKHIFLIPYSSNDAYCHKTCTSAIDMPVLMWELKKWNNSLVIPALWNKTKGNMKFLPTWDSTPGSWLSIWCLLLQRYTFPTRRRLRRPYSSRGWSCAVRPSFHLTGRSHFCMPPSQHDGQIKTIIRKVQHWVPYQNVGNQKCFRWKTFVWSRATIVKTVTTNVLATIMPPRLQPYCSQAYSSDLTIKQSNDPMLQRSSDLTIQRSSDLRI